MEKSLTNLLIDLPSLPSSVLTIGSFDGVHIGHQYLLDQLQKSRKQDERCVIVTFSNHPLTFFQKDLAIPLITSLAERLSLLEHYCPGSLIVPLPFTQTLAQTSYEDFLQQLHAKWHFHTLVLGKGALLGKDRQGNEEKVTLLGQKIGFKTQYITKKEHDQIPCSSARIRKLIEQEDLSQVSLLLNRPYP